MRKYQAYIDVEKAIQIANQGHLSEEKVEGNLLYRKLAEIEHAQTFTKFSMAASLGVTVGSLLLATFPVANSVAAAAAIGVALVVGYVLKNTSHFFSVSKSDISSAP